MLLNVLAHELQTRVNGKPTPENIFDAVEAVHKRCSGGYAIVAMIIGYGIVAFRDPNGIRPLVLGEREGDGGKDYMVASESVALDALQFNRVRDLHPGECLYIENRRRAEYAQLAGRSKTHALHFRIRVFRPSRLDSR